MSDSNVDRLSAALSGRYRIERELGAGGMATVYLAADLKHKRKVALKVLKPELAAVLGAERFVVEITTTASLSHPHILPLFDSGTAEGFLYYVMPFIEGETLRDKLTRETQLGIDEAVKIATEVADALDYAHRHGVIHRDIKPENILLHDGRPMVADFGIALAVSAAAGGRMTETGLSLGTPHYMSPEQATAEKEITGRSDVYSLASVLYEMLSGEPPHMGNSAQQIIMKIIAEPAQPVTKLRKSVPPNVAAALVKALEKLPADRFATAKEFAVALANPGFVTRSVGDSSQMLGATGAMRSRVIGMRGAAILGVLAIVAGAGIAKLTAPEATPDPTARVMLAFNPTDAPRIPTTPVGSTIALAPRDGGLLYTGPGTTTRTQFWMRQWSALRGTRLPEVTDDACCAVFSPSGDSIVYLAPPHTMTVLPLNGGVALVVADSGLTSVTDLGGGVDWGPDGMLYGSSTSGLVRLAPRGGTMERISTVDTARGDGGHLWPSVLPGAKGVIFTIVPKSDPANKERASVAVLDLRSGAVEVLVRGIRAVYAQTGHLIVAKSSGVLSAVPFDLRSLRVNGRERELPDTAEVVFTSVNFVLSADGTLAYTKQEITGFSAVWVDRDGRSEPIAPDLTGNVLDTPRLSADGARLLLGIQTADGREHIWVKSLRTGAMQRLTFDGFTNARPAWRPGTSSVTFTSDRESSALTTRLYEREGDAVGRLTRPVLHDARPVGAHSWSPDGKWLLFRTDDQAAGNADILGIRLGIDTVATPFVATPAEELGPAVSFDGRWLAYSSNESGRREVYVRPFPATSEARYQISTSGGISPGWNPDGSELFFVDAVGNLVSVPILRGGTFQTGPPRVLFNASRYLNNPFTRMYDVRADGKRFVMLRSETDNDAHIVVVFNFLDEVRRLMTRP